MPRIKPKALRYDRAMGRKDKSLAEGSAAPPRPSGKQRLLEVAEELFSTRGFQDVSAAEIGRAAGVAHGLLFHHFGSMEDLYAEVSQLAADRMNKLQLAAFRGPTARAQIASFLRAHMRAVKQREGDAVYRTRSLAAGANTSVAAIWEESRQKAIDKIFEVIALDQPTPSQRLCLRAWIGFHDQLVAGWIAEHTLTETQVLEWSMSQLEHLALKVLGVDLNLTSSSRH